jgi:hypothetical protein
MAIFHHECWFFYELEYQLGLETTMVTSTSAKHQFYTGYSTFRVSVRNGVSMSAGYAVVLADMFPRAQPVHELPP